MKFCNDQGFTSLEDIETDLDEELIDDSGIVEEMKTKFKWNSYKISQFVNLAMNRKQTPFNPPIDDEKKNEEKEQEEKPKLKPKPQPKPKPKPKAEPIVTPMPDLPLITEFVVPRDIMKQRDPRSINDIILCLKKNKLPNAAILKFKQFCKTNSYKFIDLEKNLKQVRSKFKSQHSDLIIFIDYIEKCIYELSPPLFVGGKFSRSDEDIKHRYFEKQCKGVIKHDRDLLQYFCITENTEKELPSQLIDIADRFALEEKQELNVEKFGQKYFFKHCDKMQVSKVKNGLRKYHNRFLPLFPKNPLKQVADKISGYQKYCILLSHIISNINKQIQSGYNGYNNNKTNKKLIPFMIDMMILPPGCFNKVEDANTKTYDASGPKNIGNIKEKLKAFKIPINETRGLSDKPNNFDIATNQRMTKQIIKIISKLTNNFTKKNQRICILIDRRWRIKTKKFDAFNKLRNYGNQTPTNDIIDDGTEGGGGPMPPTKHKKSSSWFGTKGFFGGGSDGYDNDNNNDDENNINNNDNNDFYNARYDTIYVYQPDLTKENKQNKSYHEFNNDYCHETLIYLTKSCIIPRKNHYMHIGGDTTDGWLFNISAHIQKSKNDTWYKYEQRWYIFLQSAALRFFPQDMTNLWPKYFIDSDEDSDKFTYDQIKKQFAIDLQETDPSYKRWYYAIKRSD